MADKKISELVNLTSLATDDEFVVVDKGANATKRITATNLNTGLNDIPDNKLVPDGGTIGSASDPDAMAISSGGVVTFSQGIALAAGKGIDFSATANGSGTTTSELFDDYEEGTWTPTYVTDSGFSASAFTFSECYYRKIGDTVFIWGSFTSNGSDAGIAVGDRLVLSGLPYTIESTTGPIVRLGSGFVYVSISSSIWAEAMFVADPANETLIVEIIVLSGTVPANSAIHFTGFYKPD